jgi:hypothetical protein
VKAVTGAVAELGGVAANFRIVDATTWLSSVQQPAVDATVDDLLTVIAETKPGDTTALRTGLTTALTKGASSAPLSDRVVDPKLLHSLTGGALTPAEIEAGQFQVVPPPDPHPYWVVLDVALADITLEGQ